MIAVKLATGHGVDMAVSKDAAGLDMRDSSADNKY